MARPTSYPTGIKSHSQNNSIEAWHIQRGEEITLLGFIIILPRADPVDEAFERIVKPRQACFFLSSTQ